MRHTVALAFGQDLELGEGFPQLPRSSPESTRLGADLAERGHGQYTAGSQSIDHEPVESRLPEHMTDHQIHGQPRRQALVEIPHLELASVGDTTPTGKLASQIAGDWRHIHSEHAHTSLRQPHRHLAASTGDLQGSTLQREQMLGWSERLRQAGLSGRPIRIGIPLVPTSAILVTHVGALGPRCRAQTSPNPQP
jgi:hypothetical protein